MKTADFDYSLPPEYIAQHPVEPRHASRLLVLDRQSEALTHARFSELGRFVRKGDLLVANQTQVIPARLYATKVPSGGQVELLLLARRGEHTWEALVGGKRVTRGKRLALENGLEAEVIEELSGARRVVRFDQPLEPHLEQIGRVPLPPYIHAELEDPGRYQTVYARRPGSAAAPTAGLHFSADLIAALEVQGVGFAQLTLHVGLDTFAPVTEEDPSKHRIHSEWCQLPQGVADEVNATRARGGRVIAVGTTSVRVLETGAQVASADEAVSAFEGPTELFILPGHRFRAVDAMITNFHLPRSTLLMLVSAFAGRQRILDAYQAAIEEKYRFYSFGDAMLIL